MKTQIPEINSAWLLQYLLSCSLSRQDIAAAANLPVERPLEQFNRIAFVDYIRLLNWASKVLKRKNLGLELALLLSPGDLGPLSQAAYHFATVRETLQALDTFHPLVSQCIHLHFEELPNKGRLTFDVTLPISDSLRHDNELTLALFVRGAREAIAENWAPMQVTFKHPKPADITAHEQYFGCELVFDHADNSVVYHNDDLDLEISGRDVHTHRRFTSQLQNLMDDVLREETILAHTRFYIGAMLGTEHCHATEVARLMNMSRRTLTRHLGNMGTGFRQIKEDVIMTEAKRMLRQQRWNTTAIALELGFSDATAFNRAFKASTFLTPGQYRKNILL